MIICTVNTSGKWATVTFDYDELRCVVNALFEVSRFDDVEKDDNFNDVRAKFIELFALVKHGNIPNFELKQMYKLLCEQDHPTEKGGVE